MPLPMYQEKKSTKQTKIIAIAAGKGGVGKSTVTVNLAEALSRQGFAVGVLDCDLYGPSMRKMLPDEQPPEQRENIFIPGICRMGIRMLSMAYFRPDSEATVMRGPIANSIILQFLKDVEWGELDYLLLDFPPGTGDIQLTLAQQAKLYGAILVTTPQEVARLDVRKAKEMFTRLGVPILGVVENMSYFIVDGKKQFVFGQGGGRHLAAEWSVPLLGEIPVEAEISRCGDEGTSIFNSPTGDIFRELAQYIMQPAPEKEKTQLAINKLYMKSTGLFTIEWNDQQVIDYKAEELQLRCPCARCHEAKKGNQPVELPVKPVTIEIVEPVGHYALKIRFSSGCSMGIYPFEMLRSSS